MSHAVFRRVFHEDEQLEYLLKVPMQAPPLTGHSLLLHLHGFSDGPESHASPLTHAGSVAALDGCVLVAPYCPVGKPWRPVLLRSLVDSLIKEFRVDRGRLFLTGFSMGGHAVLNLLAKYPSTFAAAVAVAAPSGLGAKPVTLPALPLACCASCFPGRAPLPFQCLAPLAFAGCLTRLPDEHEHSRTLHFREDELQRSRGVPLWIVYSTADGAVPLRNADEVVNAFSRVKSNNVRRTTLVGVGHAQASVEAFSQPELYCWLHAQRRLGPWVLRRDS